MAKSRSFHAFTFGAEVYGGAVSGYVFKAGTLRFEYVYVEAGVTVSGRFEAERDGASFSGTWTETSSTPIAGETSWNGRARLTASDESDGRVLLSGDWEMVSHKGAERWVVDVATK
jgi:hypothetical protein